MTLAVTADPAPGDAAAVRPAAAADYPAIRSLLRSAYGPYALTLPPDVFGPYLDDLLDLETHRRHGTLLIAAHDKAIVGYVAFYADSQVQGLGWPEGWSGGRGLAVDPSARGHGVAQMLIAACEGLARGLGAPVFAFHTAGFMSAARRLYDHLGYQRAPEYDLDMAKHYGVHGCPPIRSIAFRRDLAAAPRHRS